MAVLVVPAATRSGAGLVLPERAGRALRSRGTSNSNQRGNSRDRARRRQWLVETYGDGELVACFLQISRHCLYVLDVDTVSADRIDLGGSYRRSNIQPACGPCQCYQGGLIGAARAHGFDTPRR